MTMQELVLLNRSYRRFDEQREVTKEELYSLISLCRTVPSTANSQALRFYPVWEKEKKEALFPHLGWAAALPEWGGPKKGERPGGYIVLLCDKSIAPQKPIDCGICGQTIQLGATEMGLGGCMLMNIKRSEIASALSIDTEKYAVEMVIALGKPAEKVVLVPLPEDGSVRYYRDEDGTHYVPKRALEDLIVE